MSSLEEKIGYRFKRGELLQQALTHSSFGYENSCPHNERLEFLGDAILGYVVSRKLFEHFPEKDEGTLSKLKSVLVSSQTLAKKAKLLGLGPDLRLGKGETRAGGHKKKSILSDAVEALIGAISLDGGPEAAERFIGFLYNDEIKDASIEIKNAVDFKTLLQEKLQEHALGLPDYSLVKEEGPAHDRRFLMQVSVGTFHGPMGRGKSKKSAQQECARLLLEDESFWKAFVDASTVSNI